MTRQEPHRICSIGEEKAQAYEKRIYLRKRLARCGSADPRPHHPEAASSTYNVRLTTNARRLPKQNRQIEEGGPAASDSQ